MKNQKTIDTPENSQNPILQLIELSPHLPKEATNDVANRIADWINSGQPLLDPYVEKQIVYAKKVAQAYQKANSPSQKKPSFYEEWSTFISTGYTIQQMRKKACWCKDCKYGETSEDEGKPYCICNNNKSNNWQELMDIYSSCKHCEPRERRKDD